MEKRNIHSHKVKRIAIFSVLISFELIVAVFLSFVCNAAINRIHVYDMYSNIVLQGENKEDYYAFINDSNSDDLYSNYDEKKANQLLDEILLNNDCYIMYSYLPNNIDGVSVQRCIANDKFLELYDFDVQLGRGFKSLDYKYNDGDEVPILVGANLKDVYNIDGVYEFSNGDNGKSFNARVIGILQEDTINPTLQEVGGVLDNSYIIPMNEYFADYYFGLSDYDMAISSLIIKADFGSLENAKNTINASKMYNAKFISVKSALDDYYNDFVKSKIPIFVCSLIIDIVLITIMCIQIIIIIKRRKNRKNKEIY